MTAWVAPWGRFSWDGADLAAIEDAALPAVDSVDVTDTQPIPVPDDSGRNLLYTPLRVQVTNGSTDADEEAAKAMAEAEAAILDRLAEKTSTRSPWDAALALFGQPSA